MFYNFLNSQYCPVCRQKVSEFLPLPEDYYHNLKKYGFKFDLDDFETLNHRSYSCPHCFSSDRERLYAILFQELHKLMPVGSGERRILDFAPSKAFSDFMAISHRSMLAAPDITAQD